MADDDGFDDESLLASVIAAERDAGAAWTSGEPKSAPAPAPKPVPRAVPPTRAESLARLAARDFRPALAALLVAPA